MQISDPDSLKEDGLALFNRGERDEALAYFEKASSAYAEIGDMAGKAEMYNNIGVIYRMQSNWPAAKMALEQSEAGFAEAGDDRRRAQVLGNLGDLYAGTRNYTEAARYYGDSAELFVEVGDAEKRSQVLRAFSLMRLRQRHWVEAMDLMAKSLQAHPRPSLLQRLFLASLNFALKLLTGK